MAIIKPARVTRRDFKVITNITCAVTSDLFDMPEGSDHPYSGVEMTKRENDTRLVNDRLGGIQTDIKRAVAERGSQVDGFECIVLVNGIDWVNQTGNVHVTISWYITDIQHDYRHQGGSIDWETAQAETANSIAGAITDIQFLHEDVAIESCSISPHTEA